MLRYVNFENAYLHGNVIESLFKLRYEQFYARQNYDVYTLKDKEFDRYDTYATNYIVFNDEHNNVIGTSRKAPTNIPYMIEEIWPDLIKGTLPKADNVWESSRFCVDNKLPPEQRKKIIAHLVAAGQLFGLNNNIDYFVGVMHPAIWRAVFIKNGWDVQELGDIKVLQDGSKVVACKMPVSEKIMNDIQNMTNINLSSLQS